MLFYVAFSETFIYIVFHSLPDGVEKRCSFYAKNFWGSQLHQSCAKIAVSESCFVSIIRIPRIDLGDGDSSESFKSYIICFV